MRAGALPLVLCGLALLLVVVLGVAVWSLDALPAGLLAGAGAAAVLTGAGAGLAARRGRVPAQDEPLGVEVLPRSSVATVAVASGLTLALVGSVAGQAILWPGVGVLALGIGGLVREQRAARRLLRGDGGALSAAVARAQAGGGRPGAER
jgi:hypothetical protein